MKLSRFYPNILNDFNVVYITTNIDKIKNNCIFINLNNLTNLIIPKILKKHVFIVTQIPILDNSINSITVSDLNHELVRIYNIFFNLEQNKTKLVGILNDDCLDYSKVLSDLFNNIIKDKIAIINISSKIDEIYNLIGLYSKKKYKYIFIIFTSNEILDYLNILYFDYIILPKTYHTTSKKGIININKFLKTNGVIINNFEDFKDVIVPNYTVTFGFSNNCTYEIHNLKQHNKIFTGLIIKDKIELSEILVCINNIEYIYFIFALFAFFDNEYQSVDLIHIFFSKYIL